MKLEQLMARGAVVSAEPVKVDVKWTHDDPETGEEVVDEFSVHVLKRSFGAVERLWSAAEDKSRSAMIISECVRFGEAGEERMTYEQAYQLEPGLATVLLDAYSQVNAAKRPKP